MSRIEARLSEQGITIHCKELKGRLMPCRQEGNLLFVGGHGPIGPDGVIQSFGKLGREVTVEQGQAAARLAAVNTLASLKAVLGDLDRIESVVKVTGFINSDPEFFAQGEVMNAYSDVWEAALGQEQGRHARSAIGVAVLPHNIPVEVECILRLRH